MPFGPGLQPGEPPLLNRPTVQRRRIETAVSWWIRPPDGCASGADDGTRTRNLRFTKPLLYQLSYVGATGRAIPQMTHSAPGMIGPTRSMGQACGRRPRSPDRRLGAPCGLDVSARAWRSRRPGGGPRSGSRFIRGRLGRRGLAGSPCRGGDIGRRGGRRRIGCRRHVGGRRGPASSAPWIGGSGAGASDTGARRTSPSPSTWPSPLVGATAGAAGGPSTSRWATASKSRIEPATAAFSEPTAPLIGIRMNTSHRRRTAGPRPWPSLPTTIASGPRRSVWRAVSGASPRRRRSAARARAGRLSAAGRSSTGQSSRCSTAPADALTAAGLSGAWRCVGKMTPWTPAASALRSSVPDVLRVLERVEHEDERRLAAFGGPGEDVVEASRTARLDDERDALVAVEAGERRQRPALDLDDRDAQARGVEDELLERVAALRDDQQPDAPVRRAAKASSTGRRPATSSSSGPSRSGGGSGSAGRTGGRSGPGCQAAVAAGGPPIGPASTGGRSGRRSVADGRSRRGPRSGRPRRATAVGRPPGAAVTAAGRPVTGSVVDGGRSVAGGRRRGRSRRAVGRPRPERPAAGGRRTIGRASVRAPIAAAARTVGGRHRGRGAVGRGPGGPRRSRRRGPARRAASRPRSGSSRDRPTPADRGRAVRIGRGATGLRPRTAAARSPRPARSGAGPALRTGAGPSASRPSPPRRSARPGRSSSRRSGQPRPASTLRRQRWPSRVSSTATPRAASSSRSRSDAAQSRAARAAARSSSSAATSGSSASVLVGQDAEHPVEVAQRAERPTGIGGRQRARARSVG